MKQRCTECNEELLITEIENKDTVCQQCYEKDLEEYENES